jgi:radical SAM superfamily enzyme YgiQ (UPF0313 family)
MPHATLVSLVGVRCRDAETAALMASLPGLRARGAALAGLPPLGTVTVAAATPPGWTASHREIDLDTLSPGGADALAAAVEAVRSDRPAVVGVSAMAAGAADAVALSAALGRADPRMRTVAGGLWAAACPDEAAAAFDAVVVGDGEAAWPAVLSDAAAGSLRRVYRPAPFDLSAEGLPPPRFDLLGRRRRYALQTARGCPLACDFCGAARLLGPFREKPAEAVRSELTALDALDAPDGKPDGPGRARPRAPLELADDNTFAGGRDPAPLLDALAGSGRRWFAEADWRVGERPGLPEALAAAGCEQLLIGFESPVHRHAGMGAKASGFDRMMAAAEALQSAGVAVLGAFVAGSDGETPASLDALAAFLLSCPLADVQVTLATPMPGTALRRRLASEGRLLPGRGPESCTLVDAVHRPDRMTVAELEAGFRRVLSAVFAEGPTRRREAIRRGILRRRRDRRRNRDTTTGRDDAA